MGRMLDGKTFAGLKVLDMSQGVATPHCGMMLAQHGASVTKVEPFEGDWSRIIGKRYDDFTAATVAFNRGKRGLALDLKKPEGLEITKKLAAEADVVLQSFRPGVIERLGLDYATVAEFNPDVIYLSLSGFGSEGPYAKNPGTDSVMQAYTGFMSINRDANGMPHLTDIYVVDLATSLYLFSTLVTALYQRRESGEGCHIETSLAEAMGAFHAYKMVEHHLQGGSTEIIGAPVGTFETADGYMNINARRDTQFPGFCKVAGTEEWLDDPRFSSYEARKENAAELLELVREVVKAKPTEFWRRALDEEGVLNACVNTFADLFEDEQVKARDFVSWVGHDSTGRIPMPKIPALDPVEDGSPLARSPHIGSDSREVLAKMGYSDDRIEALIADGVVKEYDE
ncbi:MAG: CoA transferase [Rhodospirillaceae bacterium]|nr:CoA transferase [Rhodospirillaceae bacterium]